MKPNSPSKESFQKTKKIKLDTSWRVHLEDEFDQPYMMKLRKFLVEQIQQKDRIFPQASEYFLALNATPLEQVKVVILGQDPYHGAGQAHGLCFSVRPSVPFPPSLKNIFAELKRDIGVPYPRHGCLQSWAEQGVLLLNSVLTVSEGKAGSHQGQGWEKFTDRILYILNQNKKNVVYMLWGSYAWAKGKIIDSNANLILKTSHPSPLSAHRGFLGCSHFSKANNYLKEKSLSEIDWSLLKM